MKLKQVAHRLDLDSIYRDFETESPITENSMIEVLKFFIDEKNDLYSATISTKDDYGNFKQNQYFGEDIFTAIKDQKIYPEFLNAFYINRHTGHYAYQINMYLNSNKVHYIVSRKASRSFNKEKDFHDMSTEESKDNS